VIHEFASGTSAADLWPLGPLGGALAFAVSDDPDPLELWRTDGTPGGTAHVTDLGGSHGWKRAESFRPLGRTGLAFFLTPWSDWEPGLWLTDGTAEGTRRLGSCSEHVPFRGTVLGFHLDGSVDAFVPCGLGLSACDVDDDGDGFSTELEVAAGTRWSEADSTPLGPGGGGPAGDLEIGDAEFAVTGYQLDADVLRIEGTLPVRAGFAAEGERIIVDAGGAIRTLTLDRRGRAREGDADFRLRLRRRGGAVREDPTARFTFSIRRGRLMEPFADEGVWEPTVKEEEPLVLPVTVLFDGRAFRARLPMLWTVRSYGEGRAVLDRR
jgi:ELWxxDGT repeat protein